MSYTIRISPLVSFDIREASNWYGSKSSNLGLIFEEHTFKALEELVNRPLISPTRYSSIRIKRISKKFPYYIHYEVLEKEKLVVVYALFHGKRSPKKWSERIR